MKKRLLLIIAVLFCVLLLIATATACKDDGDTGENPGGDVIENPGGDIGENPGDNPGGDTGENPGGDTGENPGGDVTENPEPEVYYTVTFDTQGGSAMASVEVKEGAVIGNVTLPTKQCAEFVGFTEDANGEVIWDIASDKVTGNITLYAIWEDAHTWEAWKTVSEPTCAAEGARKRICDKCGDDETERIPALGHDFEEEYTVDVAPDCVTKGSESRHCTRCDATTDSREIEATGHTWGEWATLTEPTCIDEGLRRHICDVCGEEDTDNIPALGHDFEEEYTVDVAPDCETKGSESRHCTRCDATTDSREIEATGHTWIGWETLLEPTCTVEGMRKRTCVVCGEEESDSIPALGHDFVIWEYDENYHWKICSRCGAISEKTAHAYDGADKCECGALKSTPASEFAFTYLGDNTWGLCEYIGNSDNIVIPSRYSGGKVVSIESSAFADCNGITSVIVPDSVTSIGEGAFSGCGSLESITLPFVGAEAGKTSSDTYQYPFGYIFGTDSYTGGTRVYQEYYGSSTSSTTYSTYYIPSSLRRVTVTGGNILYGAFYCCSMLTSVTIGNSVTSIGERAFSDCTGLASIEIPDSVTSIGSHAFSSCTGLSSVTIPDSVKSIGDNAFLGCTRLISVTIGNSVTSIGDYAFEYCYKLVEVYNKSSLNITAGSEDYGEVGYYAKHVYTEENGSRFTDTADGYRFLYDGKKGYLVSYYGEATDISLPDSFTAYDGTTVNTYEIIKYAFYGNIDIASIKISNSVTRIGDYAFIDCYKLVEIYNASALYITVGSLDNGYVGYYAKNVYTEENGSRFTDTADGYRFIYDGTNGYLVGYYGEATDISLPESFSAYGGTIVNSYEINRYAFYGNTALTSVVIPDSVTSIGDNAFSGCTMLTSVTIGNSVTSIGNNAFYNCCKLISVYYTGDITGWCGIAFSDSYANPLRYSEYFYIDEQLVTDLVIPDSITEIKNHAFTGCTGLTSVTIPDSVTSIGSGAFSGCSSIESITIPFVGDVAGKTSSDTYQYPLGYLFGTESYTGGTGIKQYYYGYSTSSTTYSTYYIPSSLRSVKVTGGNILRGAFYGCSMLTTVTLPDSVASIGDYAFYNCTGLTSVPIPNSVESIGDYAFSGCTAEIIWGDNPAITVIGEYAFREYGGDSVVIPDSVTSIGEGAFFGCSSLESITIPFVGAEAGKTSQDTYQYPFGYIFGTFSYTGGTEVTQSYYGSSTSYTTSNTYYIPSSLRSVTVTGGNILYRAFDDCSMLTSVTMGNSVTSIGNNAFYGCAGLTSVTIGNSVTSIGNNAFTYCTGLTSVTIGNSVTSIGSNAFYDCRGLTSVYYTGDIAGWCVIDGLGNIVGNGRALYIGGRTLEGELIIPDTVTEIKSYAFYNCAGLTSVTIPDSVTSIGSYAFAGCAGLTSVTIPDSVKSIGGNAFSGCAGLTSVTIPDSVTGIGSYVFSGCAGLASVTIPDSVTSIGSYAFYGCTGLASVEIPNSVTSIREGAFWGCRGLTSVTIGNSVKSIGYAAFADCYKLVEVYNKSSLSIRAGDSSYGDVGYYAKNVYTKENGSWFTDTAEGYRFIYDGTKGYLIGYYGEATDITLPDSFSAYDGTNVDIYEIIQCAFYGNNRIISVVIPDFVTSISDYTFYNCTGLTSVTIGNSVISIGYEAFRGCKGLNSVTIPDSVTSIGSYAFSGCTGLTSVYYTGDITGWCGISFGYWTSNPLCYAHNLYIDGQLVTELVIPDTVTEIKSYAFYNCTGLTSVTIPDSVTSIGDSAFYGCTGLTSVEIPNSVTSIGEGAFSGCSTLESITIPFVGAEAGKTSSDRYQYPFGYIFGTDSYTGGTKVTQWYYGSSYSSTTSTTYYIPSSLRSVTVTGGNILYGAFYGCSMLTSVIIGDGAESIGNSAFWGCTGLTSVTIGNSVESIVKGAFSGCSSLESITIPFVGAEAGKTSSDTYQYPFGYIFGTDSYTGGTKVRQDYYGYSTSNSTYDYYYIPSSLRSVTVTGRNILYGAFYGCSMLTTVTLPDSVKSIGRYAFYGCAGLTSVTIPDSVTSIGSYAFADCTGLASVTIGNSVESIGDYAFYGCAGLTSVTIGNSVTSIGRYAFSGCTGLTSVTIPDTVESIGDYAFYNCTGLTSVTIGNSVTSIANSAFSGCTNLIQKENGVSYVDKWVIDCDTSVSEVILRNGTVGIGDNAFENCTGLTSVNIPDLVTSIGGYAFYGCAGLTSVTIGTSVTSIGSSAFRDCTGLTSVVIPDSVTSIGGSAFYNCQGLTSVAIGNSVTSIGNYAFYNCQGLTSVTIGTSVTSIGDYAFSDCYKLVEVYNKSSLNIRAGNSGNGYIGYYAKHVYTEENGSRFTDTADGYRFLYNGAKGYLVGYYGEATDITLPESFTAYDGTIVNSYEIYRYAFYGNTALISVTISDSVTSIGEGAFSGCSSLESITIPFVGAEAGKTSSDTYQYPFGYIFGTDSYTGGTGVRQDYYGYSTSSTTYDYYYIPLSLRNVTVTGGNILYRAFDDCSMLTSVTIGNSVTSIGDSAFYDCSGLTSVTIGNSVTSIGSSAFRDCTGLTSVTIPDSVTSIGSYAFENCTGLTSVTIGNSVKSIEWHAFSGCTGLNSVVFEDTEGWQVSRNSDFSSYTSLASTDLADASTAATYLKSTYWNYDWRKV